MSEPKTAQQIVDFKNHMKVKNADIYQQGRAATESYQSHRSRGFRGRGASGMLLLSAVFFMWGGDAFAHQIRTDIEIFAEDCRGTTQNSQDWALVALLDMRHGMNQQALFSGDLAMRSMLKHLGGCK